MKKSSFLLLLFTFLFSFHSYSQQAQYGFYDKFYTGILSNGIQPNYSQFSGIHLNLWMHYVNWWDNNPNLNGIHNGWTELEPNDWRDANLNQYEYTIRDVVLANNTSHGYRTIGERPKIDWLCYGQRSNYQAERKSLCELYYDFYSYEYSVYNTTYADDIPDNTIHGYGQYVKHCWPDPSVQPGTSVTILSGLNANREQVNTHAFSHPYMIDINHNFYIKPRIRIDAGLPYNNEQLDVCRIKVYNWIGNLIKETLIKAGHFKDQTHPYTGQYIEGFFFNPGDSTLLVNNFIANENLFNPNGYEIGNNEPVPCQVDIQVDWFGNCDMWIDYVRVDDDAADGLMNPNSPNYNTYNLWIQQEVQNIAMQSGDNPLKFYIEEFTFENIPCIGYVNKKLKEYSGNKYSLMCDMNGSEYCIIHRKDLWSSGFILTPEYVKRTLIDSAGLDEFFTFAYPLLGYKEGDPKFGVEVYVPSTLPSSTYAPDEGRFSKPKSPAEYDTWLQDYLDREDNPLWNECFTPRMKLADEVSKQANKPFVNIIQEHLWYSQETSKQKLWCKNSTNGGNMYDLIREPTNEEVEMMTNVSVTYGARAEFYFVWMSGGEFTDPFFFRSLAEPNTGLKRLYNVYNQGVNGQGLDKFEALERINGKLEAWSTTLMSFNNTDRHSYIYRDENERYVMRTNSYINDVASYIRGTGTPICEDDNPGDNPPENLRYECQEDRYLQVATFNTFPSKTAQYFMIVNRRCSPVQPDHNDGERYVRINFHTNSNYFQTYNTWKIKNVANPDFEIKFSKNYTGYLDLDWFAPGEGKLFKIVPVVPNGGTLVADEYIPAGEEFTCEDTVWTNGYNLTIENGVTINFSDSAKFVVEGGTFQIGDPNYQGSQTTEMDGSWKGFEFIDANVKIYNTDFSGLANDSISMLTMINCPLIDLRNNTFALGSGTNKGAIEINYTGSYQSGVTDNVYLAYNEFSSSSTELPYVKVMAYSGFTTPVLIENNNFTGSSTALFLNNIQGGAIKSNSFTGFGRSITALTSSLDVYDNTISSSSNGSYGLEALEGTELKMSYSGGLLVGGRNDITNSGTSVYNIYLENSYFLMDEGENIFDIGDDSYHLYGWFPSSYGGEYLETENCFKVEGVSVDPPLHYVTLGDQGAQITDFDFTPYLTGCLQGGEGDMMVINLGNGIYDTIGIMGEGGSYSSNYIVTPKSLYDSISISMRYRNYANVKTLCLYLLNTYPDSVQSLGAVSKLYLAVSKTDTTTQGITNLKTLYGSLILNHSSNTSLVKRCNYYVQKCKVLLHQYSSALSGFQQIINQNPASYEGLIARWDYMATSLLMQGQGGAERNWDFGFAISDLNKFDESDEFDKSDKFDDDRSPFSKEERKQIKQAVTTALEISKSTEKKREEVLTELSTRGDVKATKQLKVLKSLQQTVKVEKPKDIVEHLKIVSGDIQKVFVKPNASKNANTQFIPQVYSLSQNYPNPFNPVTKINYDIPKNSIVKLVIYDILGREVVKLVNNEFKQPGRYVVEFNGTNFASGVYFYRIEAGDYVMSKKMVLVK